MCLPLYTWTFCSLRKKHFIPKFKSKLSLRLTLMNLDVSVKKPEPPSHSQITQHPLLTGFCRTASQATAVRSRTLRESWSLRMAKAIFRQ